MARFSNSSRQPSFGAWSGRFFKNPRPLELMAKHKHGRTLRMILLKAGAKPQFGSSTDFVHMHFYKVPAHSGIEGNEIADELAKAACLEPTKAQVINLLEDNSMVCVIIRDSVGNNIDLSKLRSALVG